MSVIVPLSACRSACLSLSQQIRFRFLRMRHIPIVHFGYYTNTAPHKQTNELPDNHIQCVYFINNIFFGLLLCTLMIATPPKPTASAGKQNKTKQQQVRMKENFAFSGQIVRALTMKTRYQTCDASKPECCGNYGCCDSRGWRLILILTVGSLAGLLFLSFVSVLAYTAVVNR